MKPVFLITVHRRYHEFAKNLGPLRERCREELGHEAECWAVWAAPEPGREWLFSELVASGALKGVFRREAMPCELGEAPCATTVPESANIRLGLSRLSELFPARWCVAKAADVSVNPGTLSMMAAHLGEPLSSPSAFVWFWENGCHHSHVWHTNLFAVSLSRPDAWPPVGAPGCADSLERQWGRILEILRIPGIASSHNSGQKRFVHAHESETLPAFPVKGVPVSASLPLVLRAGCPWWRWPYERLLQALGRV